MYVREFSFLINKSSIFDGYIHMANNNTAKRFLDAGAEPTKTLTPLEGYEKKDLVSLDEAVKPINVSIYNLNTMIWAAKRNSQNPSDGLTSDESSSIGLYTMECPFGPDPTTRRLP